jgi:hypothetical protein
VSGSGRIALNGSDHLEHSTFGEFSKRGSHLGVGGNSFVWPVRNVPDVIQQEIAVVAVSFLFSTHVFGPIGQGAFVLNSWGFDRYARVLVESR